ncbi:MAG: hypothetical protein IJ401_01510 [Oscillospiraceae bacterium]|nr:hypothetical protein [Oscillospiraceae bacterium]
MKKLLAMTLAALMALSMAACGEKEDDEDEKDTTTTTTTTTTAAADDKKEEADKPAEDEKPADDKPAEDEKPADDDNKDDGKVEVTPSSNAVGTLEGNVITAGNLTLTVPDGWIQEEMDGNVFFVPSDYLTTGNNLNIMIANADPFISTYDKSIIEDTYSVAYPDFKMEKFEHTKISGYEAIEMAYGFSGMGFTQIMIGCDDASYILTFTGNTGDFADLDTIIDSVNVK